MLTEAWNALPYNLARFAAVLMAEALCRAARLGGERPALVIEDVSRSWSDVRERVSRIAGNLRRALALTDGDRICVLSDNSAAFFELYFAAPWAGLVMASLNTRWSRAEMVRAVSDCLPAALLVGEGFEATGLALREAVPSVRAVIAGGAPFNGADTTWDDLAECDAPIAPRRTSAHEAAFLFYTSGATGGAKGVALSEGNLFAASLAVLCTSGIERSSHVVITVPLFHMSGGGLLRAVVAAAAGATLMRRFEAHASLECVVRRRASHIVWVPTMLAMVLECPSLVELDLSCLRRILYGSAPMPEPLLRKALVALPGTGFTQYYGMTETSGTGVSLPPEAHDPDGSHSERLRAAGLPVPGLEIRVARPDGSESLSGEIGEIQFRGPIVMLGYWNDKAQTESAFADSWLRSGDAGFMDADGYIFVSDRLKDMIISGGENIYSTEVENAVLGHAAVRECAVVGAPDPKWGEVVVAVVRLAGGEALTLTALQAHCRESLGGFKIPRRLILSPDPLPKNATGKLDKEAIRKAVAGPLGLTGSPGVYITGW